MCGCARATPRFTRPGGGNLTVITRNVNQIQIPNAPVANPAQQAMDPERLRIEQLRREAIRRSFGSLT